MAAASDGDDEITGINVTPLVDITLVLLIVFMVTASFIVAPAIKVELPKASTAAPVQATLSIALTRDGALYLDNARVSHDELRRSIRAREAAGQQLQAVLAADAQVMHGKVVAVIDLVKAEGVQSFALNTDSELTTDESGGK